MSSDQFVIGQTNLFSDRHPPEGSMTCTKCGEIVRVWFPSVDFYVTLTELIADATDHLANGCLS